MGTVIPMRTWQRVTWFDPQRPVRNGTDQQRELDSCRCGHGSTAHGYSGKRCGERDCVTFEPTPTG